MRLDLENLAISLQTYADYLDEKNDDQKKRQMTSLPPRQVGKHAWMEIIEPGDDIPRRYLTLDQKLRQLDCYEHILFSEHLHTDKPLNYSERFHYFERLQLTVPACILSYCPGGGIGKLRYLWKVPENSSSSEILQLSMPIYDRLKEYLPEYHTRQMRKDFVSRYCNLSSKCSKTPVESNIFRSDNRFISSSESFCRW